MRVREERRRTSHQQARELRNYKRFCTLVKPEGSHKDQAVDPRVPLVKDGWLRRQNRRHYLDLAGALACSRNECTHLSVEQSEAPLTCPMDIDDVNVVAVVCTPYVTPWVSQTNSSQGLRGKVVIESVWI